MVEFKDRLVLALGERAGAGGRVIYAATQCFA